MNKAKDKPSSSLPSTPSLLVDFLAAKLVEAADMGDFSNVARMATVQGQLLGMIASKPGRPKKGAKASAGDSGEIDTDSILKALQGVGVNI